MLILVTVLYSKHRYKLFSMDVIVFIYRYFIEITFTSLNGGVSPN